LEKWENSCQYPLDGRLVVPQRSSEHGDKEKKSHHLPCQEQNPGCPAHTSLTILTEILWLLVCQNWVGKVVSGRKWHSDYTREKKGHKMFLNIATVIPKV
jgi:hypothetical protein